MSDMLERVDDCLKMGVACVRVIDPRTGNGYEHTRESSPQARQGILRVPSTAIQVPLDPIF